MEIIQKWERMNKKINKNKKPIKIIITKVNKWNSINIKNIKADKKINNIKK